MPFGTSFGEFLPTDIQGLKLWLRSDRGVTQVVSPVISGGTSPPAVTVTGNLTKGLAQSSASTPLVEIDITLGGVLGTALFSWKLNGAVQQTLQVTSTSFSLGGTGLTASFPSATYTNNNTYTVNSVVSLWTDQSGSGYSVNQGTGINRPIYLATGGPHGRPALSFSSANATFLNKAAVPFNTNSFTLFLILQSASASSGVFAYTCGSNGTGISVGIQSSNRSLNWNGVAVVSDSTSGPTTNWEKWTLTGNSTPLQTFRVNGAAQTISNSAISTAAPTLEHRVGGRSDGQYWTGNVTEIIAYNTALSLPSILQVESYLAALYSL